MHILTSVTGVIEDGSAAIDLEQDPGDIVLLTAADSELTAIALAHRNMGKTASTLRLANIMELAHNLSVDLYINKTVSRAKLVIVRLLGGVSYWPYGLEQLQMLTQEKNIPLVLLPGDANPDPELQNRSTASMEHCQKLWAYLIEGGPDNYENFLRYCEYILHRQSETPGPTRVLKSGLYWPGLKNTSLEDIRQNWINEDAPVAPILFYRALVTGGNLEPVDALIARLNGRELNPLPIFVSSLKDELSCAILTELFAQAPPSIILNTTGFAVAGFEPQQSPHPLLNSRCPVLQLVFSGSSKEQWENQIQGLNARDLAMNVVLPELDGRIITRAVSFKNWSNRLNDVQHELVSYRHEPDRLEFTINLAKSWARLSQRPADQKKIAIILANYPNRDGRIGNGVGYDTPASTLALLGAMREAGFQVSEIPENGEQLLKGLTSGRTNEHSKGRRTSACRLFLEDYRSCFQTLPPKVRNEMLDRWGAPESDPFMYEGAFQIATQLFGNAAVAIQPARGYNIDPKESYHDPALVPPHGYLAFYMWLRHVFKVDAIIQNGKHGNQEWLPGKATALSSHCYPEIVLGDIPLIYPFIVNDPGEGTQAKRRSSAVIIDHLTPPMTRAENYGKHQDLEALVDEYYLAAGLDPRRSEYLREKIFDGCAANGLDADSGMTDCQSREGALVALDTYLCELKESQIRNGLHILGKPPAGDLQTDLLISLTRLPRGYEQDRQESILRALARDFELKDFDPLDCNFAQPWTGSRPLLLDQIKCGHWRTEGDTVERLEILAKQLIEGRMSSDSMPRTSAVLQEISENIIPRLKQSGVNEISSTLGALAGRFVPPGPSGAPTRGRLDVLPTGRNFFSVDNRTVPTPTAWSLGEKSAELIVQRYLQDNGSWPISVGISAWGTSNMRTGGDDIAQALALIGAKPVWNETNWRVTGFEIIPLARLGRPRVDVTMRISGFFRDAFPYQIELLDSAIRAVSHLDEDDADNPIMSAASTEHRELIAQGFPESEADRLSTFRIYGSMPGTYGAGLQALIDESIWDQQSDLARSYVNWSSYAYGSGVSGLRNERQFEKQLASLQAVIHNQDNREHDILDSDDYYQFEGGMTAAVSHLSGLRPVVYHNDHSRPERPRINTLEYEIGRVVRSRVTNPKWIAGAMRHGYKGAFEMVATVDYLFAFSATTGAVRDHHFQLTYDAFLGDGEVREFIQGANPAGCREMAQRFLEAINRGLWQPKSNSAYHDLSVLSECATTSDLVDDEAF